MESWWRKKKIKVNAPQKLRGKQRERKERRRREEGGVPMSLKLRQTGRE